MEPIQLLLYFDFYYHDYLLKSTIKRKMLAYFFQEGMHFPLEQKNTRFSPAHFKPHPMIWPGQPDSTLGI